MIVAHVLGIPVEETLSQLAPAGLLTAAAMGLVVRARFRALRGVRFRRGGRAPRD